MNKITNLQLLISIAYSHVKQDSNYCETSIKSKLHLLHILIPDLLIFCFCNNKKEPPPNQAHTFWCDFTIISVNIVHFRGFKTFLHNKRYI